MSFLKYRWRLDIKELSKEHADLLYNSLPLSYWHVCVFKSFTFPSPALSSQTFQDGNVSFQEPIQPSHICIVLLNGRGLGLNQCWKIVVLLGNLRYSFDLVVWIEHRCYGNSWEFEAVFSQMILVKSVMKYKECRFLSSLIEIELSHMKN